MLRVSISGAAGAIESFRELDSPGFSRDVYKQFGKNYQKRLFRRFVTASQGTPYAPSSIGTRKPVTGAIRGGTGDRGFGIDSGTLLAELLEPQNTAVDVNGFELYTDLAYAGYVVAFFTKKGPFAGDGLMQFNDEDFKDLSDIYWDAIEETFSKGRSEP